jgi:hypothetical protein
MITITFVKQREYCHVYEWLKKGFGLVIVFNNHLQVVSTINYYTLADLHTFQSTVAHALGFSFSSNRLLATDLNTETSTSNHYEVFLLFCLHSLWNLGTKNSPVFNPSAYDWLITALNWTCFCIHFSYKHSTQPHVKHRPYCCCRHCLRGSVFTEPLLRFGLHNPTCSTAARRGRHRRHSLIYCSMLDRVYRAVAWQRVDQICHNIMFAIQKVI